MHKVLEVLEDASVAERFVELFDKTFTVPTEPPIRAAYQSGKFENEGKLYTHALLVDFLYYDGGDWYEDQIRLLVE